MNFVLNEFIRRQQARDCSMFNEWLRYAQPGERYAYYTGPYIITQPVGRVARTAYEKHQVILFQKREKDMFIYYAQKRGSIERSQYVGKGTEGAEGGGSDTSRK